MTRARSEGLKELDRAYGELEGEVPTAVACAIRLLRSPDWQAFRIPVGVLLVLGGFLWFLPVLGIELLPLGLLLLAEDVPFLRKPVARAVTWAVRKWKAFKCWWEQRRG